MHEEVVAEREARARHQRWAVGTLQRVVRGHRARLRCLDAYSRLAALRVQRVWRGHLARRQVVCATSWASAMAF
ncbi:hypothetical protein T484DRAFT_1949188 [Baffinella frigidus]|nr:hypothetical protein T484DRAFT_1949188 [Cryptophyta sp. CCMP2293]